MLLKLEANGMNVIPNRTGFNVKQKRANEKEGWSNWNIYLEIVIGKKKGTF